MSVYPKDYRGPVFGESAAMNQCGQGMESPAYGDRLQIFGLGQSLNHAKVEEPPEPEYPTLIALIKELGIIVGDTAATLQQLDHAADRLVGCTGANGQEREKEPHPTVIVDELRRLVCAAYANDTKARQVLARFSEVF